MIIIELVEESEVEAEVAQADETRDKISLAILVIEDHIVPYSAAMGHGIKERP